MKIQEGGRREEKGEEKTKQRKTPRGNQGNKKPSPLET